MITPILKDPKSHGGTLYTFPSASRDLTRSFTNSDYEFAFSHFACLNLPDFRYGTFKDGDLKGVYLDNLCNYYSDSTESDSDSDYYSLLDEVGNNFNKCLKWHMQSYVMNYEVAILNGCSSLYEGGYDNEILRNPSERIFFNWLQKIGAIKFDGNEETIEGYGYDSDTYETLTNESELEMVKEEDKLTKTYKIGNKLYKWKGGEWKSRVLVSKTVQYIGTIDMINNVNIDYDSFNEIYLNIPASVGGSTKVHFDNIADDNYTWGMVIDIKKDIYCDADDENRDFIIGRHNDKSNISDDFDKKTLNAIYDSEYNYNNDKKEGYYSNPIYKIDNGYCINFNDDKYDEGGIENMNVNSEEDFEFNCVLIYYRIRKGNGQWFTNLYGVLFLEEVSISDYNTNNNEDDERGGYIQRYPKFKKGNSWGLKLDLKIDAQPDSQLELRDKIYDDPNEGSGMQMFTEALMQLNDCVKLFYEVKKENTDIEKKIYELENVMTGVDTVYDLRAEVNVLRSKIDEFQPNISELTGRIEIMERQILNLETKLGYLISNIPSVNVDLIRDEMKQFQNKVNDDISKLEESNNAMMNDVGAEIGKLKDNIKDKFDVIQNKIDNLESDISDMVERVD